MGWEIAAVLVCLVLSAFFSSSETALTALSRTEAEQLIAGDGRFSKSLSLWVEHPLKVLTCILIGNNIVNITASALATEIATQLLGPNEAAIPVAIGAMTFLLLTFGEISPKTIAKAHYRKLAGPMMSIMRLPYFFFYPFTIAFTFMTKGMMKLAGSPIDNSTPPVTEEQLKFLVDLGSREESLEANTATILQSVFEYTNTRVREVMVPRTTMVAIEAKWDYKRVIATFSNSGHSRVPVYEGRIDNIIGLFYAKDLLGYSTTKNSEHFDARSYLREAKFVPEQKKISDLLNEFRVSHVHMAIVVDEFGGIQGLITLEDIIEELFGEIQDEYDSETPLIHTVSPDHFLVQANCPLNEVENCLNIEFPAEETDYETIGGYITTQLGSVPTAGVEIEFERWIFRVREADQRHIIRVEIFDRDHPSPTTSGSKHLIPLHRLAS